jgi:hypothetical protein
MRTRLETDVLLEVPEIDRPFREVALGLRHGGAEAVLLVDDAHHVALGGDDDVEILVRHLPVGVDRDAVERIDDGDDELAVADRDRDHPMLAREGTRDARLDHLHVEPQRVDLEERHVRVFRDQTREKEVVDARPSPARIGEVHRDQRLERTRVFVGTGLRSSRLQSKLTVRGLDVRLLPFVDESGIEEKVAEVGDRDLTGRRSVRSLTHGHGVNGNSAVRRSWNARPRSV